MFWVVQNDSKRLAVPVEPCGTAIRMAGDSLDSCLVNELLERAHLGADRGLRERVSTDLYLSGVRDLKEQLFVTGLRTHELSNDRIVSITLDEFLSTPGVKAFSETLRVLGGLSGKCFPARLARLRGTPAVHKA